MSQSALTGSEKPFICYVCRKTLKNEEKMFVALNSEAVHYPKGFEDPDVKWISDLDWQEEFYFHTRCFRAMLKQAWAKHLGL